MRSPDTLENSHKIYLVQKQLPFGQYVEIYVDDEGSVKAKITRDGKTEQAFSVKNFPKKIDCNNLFTLAAASLFLNENCYFTVMGGDVYIQARVNGGLGGGDNFFAHFCAVLLSAGQVGAGIGMIATGVGAVGGAALLSSGLSSGIYMFTADEEDINVGDYLKKSMVGGTVGAVSGGVGSALTGFIAGSTSSAALASMSVVDKIIVGVGVGEASGAASVVAQEILPETAMEEKVRKAGRKEAFGKKMGKAIFSGGLTGGVGSAVSVPMSAVTDKLIKNASTVSEAVRNAGIGGALGGAVGGVATQVTANAVEGRDLTEGVLISAGSGALVQGMIASGSMEHQIQENKIRTRRAELLRARKLRLAQSQAEKKGTRSFESGSKEAMVDEDISDNLDNRSRAPKRTAAQMSVGQPERPLITSDSPEFEALMKKMGCMLGSDEAKKHAAFFDEFLKDVATPESQTMTTKHLGHLRNQSGIALTDPKPIVTMGEGGIFSSSKGKIVISNPNHATARLVNLEGSDDLMPAQYKLYAQYDLLLSTDNIVEIAALKKSIQSLTTYIVVIRKHHELFENALKENGDVLCKSYGLKEIQDVWQAPEEIQSRIFTEVSEKYFDPSDLANALVGSYNNLEVGESIHLPAGFFGHAFPVELFKTVDGPEVIIYNAGAGAKQFHFCENLIDSAGNKQTVVHPYVVKPRDLFNYAYEIFEAKRTAPMIEGNLNTSGVFDKIYPHGSQKDAKVSPSLYVSKGAPGQTVGNCATHNLAQVNSRHFTEAHHAKVLEHEVDTTANLRRAGQKQFQSERRVVTRSSAAKSPHESIAGSRCIPVDTKDTTNASRVAPVPVSLLPASLFHRTSPRFSHGMTMQMLLSAIQEWELHQAANAAGFECRDVGRDGNCFFHAVTDQFQLLLPAEHAYRALTVSQLRERAVHYVLEHISEYSEFLTEGVDAFIEKISQSGDWADHIIIEALCKALGIKIEILRQDGVRTPVGENTSGIPVLHVGHQDEFHFQSLHPRHAALHARGERRRAPDTDDGDARGRPRLRSSR